MAKVSVDSIEIVNYGGSRTPSYIGALPTRDFTNQDGEMVLGGRISTNKANLIKVDVHSGGDGYYYSDAFTGAKALSATRWNGVDQGVYWNFYLLDDHNRVIETLYENIVISDTVETTSIKDAEILSRARYFPRIESYWSTDEIEQRLNDLDLAPDATTLVKGKVKLSKAGTDTATADNDTRLVDDLSKHSDSLATAVTNIALLGNPERILTINSTAIVDSSLTIPSNITLDFGNNGLLDIESADVVIGRMNDAGNRKIFNLKNANVRFADNAVSHFNAAWWAGTDTDADISVALSQILESHSLYGGICRIYIPHVSAVCDGGYDLPSAVRIYGNGNNGLASQGKGTSLKLKSDSVASYLFKISHSLYDIGFEDINLDANGVEAVGVLAEAASPSPATIGVFFNRVTFAGFTKHFYHHSTSGAWQLAQVGFYGCQFGGHYEAAFASNSVNGQYTFNLCYFAPQPGAVNFDIGGGGWMSIKDCEFAGSSYSKSFDAAAVNTSTNTVSLPSHGFDDAAPVIIISDGTKPATSPADIFNYIVYIKKTNDDSFQLSETPGGSAIDLTSQGSGTHSAVWASAKVIRTTAAHGLISFENCYEEGHGMFLDNSASDISGQIIFSNCLIQSKIYSTGACQIVLDKCNVFSYVAQGTSGGFVFRDCYVKELSANDGIRVVSPPQVKLPTSTVSIWEETNSHVGWRETNLPQRFTAQLEALGAPSTPVVEIGHVTGGTDEDKILLRLGRKTTAGAFDFYYDFIRDHGTGWLRIEGNQTDPNKGVSFNAPVIGVANPYDASSWNGSLRFATEDAVRDEMESKADLDGAAFTGGITVPSIAVDGTVITKILKGTVSVDPASISANSVSVQTFTLSGAAVGDALILNPPSLTAGLVVYQYRVSAADTISITFENMTASPIDETAANWTYILIRS